MHAFLFTTQPPQEGIELLGTIAGEPEESPQEALASLASVLDETKRENSRFEESAVYDVKIVAGNNPMDTGVYTAYGTLTSRKLT